FKEDLQNLANRLSMKIRVAHYPPYCSKYNPAEHRLFPHMTWAMQGTLLDSVATVIRLLERTRTDTGLRVIVNLLDKVYQTGRTYSPSFKENMPILFDPLLPKWNYCAVPCKP